MAHLHSAEEKTSKASITGEVTGPSTVEETGLSEEAEYPLCYARGVESNHVAGTVWSGNDALHTLKAGTDFPGKRTRNPSKVNGTYDDHARIDDDYTMGP